MAHSGSGVCQTEKGVLQGKGRERGLFTLKHLNEQEAHTGFEPVPPP